MRKRRLTILFHGRFPSEKAAALFVAENARSFCATFDVRIIVPRRFGATQQDARPYDLPESISIVRLPVIDLFPVPILSHAAFAVSTVCFSLGSLFYLLATRRTGDVVISNDLFPALLATIAPVAVVYEVHDYPERWHALYRMLFSRAKLVIATNAWKKDALMRDFPAAASVFHLERNGVDLTAFGKVRDKAESRTALSLTGEGPLVVYTGHLYGWKGVGTLLEAATHMPDVRFYLVGGTPKDVDEHRERYAPYENITFIGHVPHEVVPLWQAAADMLVLPNTAKEEIAAHYTSPMKLFEYMASGRPIVASRLPAITEVVDETMAYLFTADDASDLARAINTVLTDPDAARLRAGAARTHVQMFSWTERAARLNRVVPFSAV